MLLDPFPPEDEEDARDFGDAVKEISPETLRAFIAVAVSVQVGLFAASLGAMLVAFRGQRVLGIALVVGGLLALAIAAAVYRRRPTPD